MKRTNASLRFATLAACLLAVACGDGGATPSPDGGASAAGGAAGARAGAGGGSSSGGASAGNPGTGGSSPADAGQNHDCPAEAPLDGATCSGRNTCRYAESVCNCVRSQMQDAGRVWDCFDTGLRDGGACPRIPPQDGDMCVMAGQRCPKANQGFCSCVVADGNLQWHC